MVVFGASALSRQFLQDGSERFDIRDPHPVVYMHRGCRATIRLLDLHRMMLYVLESQGLVTLQKIQAVLRCTEDADLWHVYVAHAKLSVPQTEDVREDQLRPIRRARQHLEYIPRQNVDRYFATWSPGLSLYRALR